jgi:hypothetical protein
MKSREEIEKETYCQLQCEKCKCGLIPIYNEKDRKFKLYCQSCLSRIVFLSVLVFI